MHTPAHDLFVAPARLRPQLWRVVLGLFLTLVVYILWVLVVLGAIWLAAGPAALNGWMERMALATTPTSVLLMLSTFGGMAAGPWVAVRLLHKRRGRTLLGPAGRTTSDFILGAAVVGLVLAASILLVDPGYAPVPNLPVNLWLSFLPMALLGVMVQTGAEEILFRGYLQQQLAARFTSPLMWMVLPSLLFGVLHFDPVSAPETALLIVAAATMFGLLAADLTRVTGSIGMAWGFHFANNCFAIVIVALDGSISGIALYHTPFSMADTDILRPLVLRDMIISVVLWAVLRGIVHWRQTRADPTP
jgi:membrane protease YdiL (CAAX protease family)